MFIVDVAETEWVLVGVVEVAIVDVKVNAGFY
jgi:hypothetical protein